jgi:hypothetical protein
VVAVPPKKRVRANVAIISIAAVRRFASVVPLFGGAKPGLPLSSAMVVVLVSQLLPITCCESLVVIHTIAPDAGAGSAGFGQRR